MKLTEEGRKRLCPCVITPDHRKVRGPGHYHIAVYPGTGETVDLAGLPLKKTAGGAMVTDFSTIEEED